MGWELNLLIIMGGLLVALMAGLPVFASFLLVDIVGVMFFMGGIKGLSALPRSMLDSVGLFTLTPVPLFVIMGEVLFLSGVAAKSIAVVERILRRLPGSLSMVALWGAALFDALTGSALGTCAMFGSLLVPEMAKRKYSKYMSMGPVMAGSMLAVVIPPSTLAVVLAAEAGIPVGKLLISGFIPGFMLTGLFAVYVLFSCLINPSLAPKGELVSKTDTSLAMDILKYLVPLSLIVLSVLGGIFTGLATPTEASALGAVASYVIAIAYGGMTKKVFIESLNRCLGITTMIFMIVAFSVSFSQLLAFTGITQGIAKVAAGLPLSKEMIVALILFILVLMGTMIDQISMIMIGVPIFMPIAQHLGCDPIWFGLLMLVAITVGLITPPFGLLLFIMKGVTPRGTMMMDVYKSALPYTLLVLLGLALIIIFPAIATWLPAHM